ncbi:MAG: restriction endonuclease [Flavobacteriaceae bacterium]|nr:restriction endonuclease [Flavobacteriaceae bacterium]
MNAFEIIRNIISDGIEQSKNLIWERLLLPPFEIENPKNSLREFNSAEEWLENELIKLCHTNFHFEKEYYASKPLMNEDEYAKADFSDNYKNYSADYYTYKENWIIDGNKFMYVSNSREEIDSLLNSDLISFDNFIKLKLSKLTLDFFKIIHNWDWEIHKQYCKTLEKCQTEQGKENFKKKCEETWFYYLHNSFSLGNILEIRKKADDLRLNYIVKWNECLNNQVAIYRSWEESYLEYQKAQKTREKQIKDLESGYLRKNADSIILFCKEILNLSKYNFYFKKEIEIDYLPETKLLMIEYNLPNIEQLPNIKETKYLVSKREYKNILVTEREQLKLFDEAIYSLTLRSIYEIFINDNNKEIESINFNGWIKSVNKATGKDENKCILSVHVLRNNFMEIDLKRIEPKSCFKFFKGVASSKLHGIIPIQPILQIDRKDERFVNSYNIQVDNSTNLAAMDWEDFEHLIRELFEKEFSSNGGEVKVTQASRDGGVDAIAFDPDPIKGGKIIIQAKRYTNTVGVSSVRDLFGTVLNEGANKGILVTTSDYGPDSYEFAKGKPITLLNGSNLLYLLERHGTSAKIDIKEAKRLLDQNR